LLALTRTLLAPVVIALAIAAIVAFVVVVVLRGGSSGTPSAEASRPSGGRAPGSPTATPSTSMPSTSSPSASVARPKVRWSKVVPTLSCGGVGTVVDALATGDLNGDGHPDAVISAHCDAGAGSPPSVVEAFL
jgi:hypothetical protein